jgi:hypothetical protein
MSKITTDDIFGWLIKKPYKKFGFVYIDGQYNLSFNKSKTRSLEKRYFIDL